MKVNEGYIKRNIVSLVSSLLLLAAGYGYLFVKLIELQDQKVAVAVEKTKYSILLQEVDNRKVELDKLKKDLHVKKAKYSSISLKLERENRLHEMIQNYREKYAKVDVTKDYSCNQKYHELHGQATAAIRAIEAEAKTQNNKEVLESFVRFMWSGFGTSAAMCKKEPNT